MTAYNVASRFLEETVQMEKPILYSLECHLLKRNQEGFSLVALDYQQNGIFTLVFESVKLLTDPYDGPLEVEMDGKVWEELKGNVVVGPWQLYATDHPRKLAVGTHITTYRLAPDYLETMSIGDKVVILSLAEGKILAVGAVEAVIKAPIRLLTKPVIDSIKRWHPHHYTQEGIIKQLKNDYAVIATRDTQITLITLCVEEVGDDLKPRSLRERWQEFING